MDLRRLFPDKPIVMGCYLREYATRAPVPMQMLKHQWARLPRWPEEGHIAGYSILGVVLINGQLGSRSGRGTSFAIRLERFAEATAVLPLAKFVDTFSGHCYIIS